MSKIVTTDLGRFRLVSTALPPDRLLHPVDGGPAEVEHAWLFECPGCGEWASRQLTGSDPFDDEEAP